MKEVNIYNVIITEQVTEVNLEPCIKNIEVAANDMKEVINTLIDGTQPVCKEEEITSITFDKKVYCYKYL